MPGVNTKCQVCQDGAAKYKCPKCRLKYCSVDCYKNHIEKKCLTQQPQLPSVEIEVDVGSSSSHSVLFPTDDTVAPVTLQKLPGSCKLRELLKNPHLRAILQEVDKSPATIQAAMLEPLFTEFTDEILNIVEPPDEDTGSATDED